MKKFSVTSTGDALFVAPYPQDYKEKSKSLRDYMNSCTLKLTNLETNLSDFEFPGNAYSGGTWINTKSEYIEYLIDNYGFDFYGNANNHAFDYGKEGMLSTIKVLEKYGLNHAGTGDSLDSAEKPAIIEKDGKKIAVFAVDASMEDASRAGRANYKFKARPGVNFLRKDVCYTVSEKQMEQLKDIAKTTRLNFSREFNIATGFGLPDKEGEFVFGGIKFTTKKGVPVSSCNKKDLDRIVNLIKKAKSENDYVFMLVHCHSDDNISHANPAEFLKEFSKAVIDAGVNAVFGGGCHELRGVEMYKGYPIFYSLGDFVYQGMRVEYLPADFNEKINIDKDTKAPEALYARSRGGTVGLHLMKENYLTVLPKITFEGDKVVDVEMMPVSLNFNDKSFMNGLPVEAKDESKEIFDIMTKLSLPFGTKLSLENNIIKVKL